MANTPAEPVDRRVLSIGGVAGGLEAMRIGRFRLAAAHPDFANTGPVSAYLVVFPRTAVWIQHAGRDAVFADPTRAMLYNRGQEYRRGKVSDDGDRCDWFAFDPRTVAEVAARFEPAAADRVERPFRATHAPVDARTYALQRRAFEQAARAETVDALLIEETMLEVLERVVAASYACGGGSAKESARTRREHAEIADAVKGVAGRDLGEARSLTWIAHAVGGSPFHVARVFRAHAGMGVHAYRAQLRLRASLERVIDARGDLTGVALDLGFSSHAHFTSAFTRAFGAPPSAFGRASKKSKAR